MTSDRVCWPGPEERIRAQSLYRNLPDSLKLLFSSAKAWQRGLDAGRIQRGGHPITRATWVHMGDVLVIQPDACAVPCAPWPSDWTYGHRETALAVVWKPAGMPTSGTGGLNLAARLPGHPVHRLDRDTSGWVVVSQSEPLTIALHRAFAEGKVDKTYLALATGGCPDHMSVHLPLNGKPCHTSFRRLASGRWPVCGDASLLEVTLHTGRTHQIRRHLHALGHGIVGDPGYESPMGRYTGSGLYLSAIRLAFDHPETGHRISVESPPPRKFRRIRWWQG